MSELYYDAWTHGNANTEPAGDINDNIIGLELEIAEVYDASGLNELIQDGLIETSCSNNANIQLEIEDDGNIQYEIIFNADTKENILKRLKTFNKYYHEFYTFEGCSAHIHLNRNYMSKIGLTENDILKAAESIAPILYRISGRDKTYLHRWCNSYLNIDLALLERFNLIDEISPDYSDRYYLMNCCNTRTMELRIFSNNCNFDYNTIKLYIEVASELIPTIALNMKNKQYQDKTAQAEIITICDGFFNEPGRDWAISFYGLHEFLDINSLLLQYNRQRIATSNHNLKQILRELNRVQYWIDQENEIEAAKMILDIIRYKPQFKIDTLNLLDLNPTIETIEATATKIYMQEALFNEF